MPREGRPFTEGYRKMKLKAVSGIMLVLLFIGVSGMVFHVQVVGIPAPSGEGTIWVEPDYVNRSLGVTFTVELWANISETSGALGGPYGCFAYAYWFGWNDTLLEIQSYNVYPPNDIWNKGIFTAENTLKDGDANTKYDLHSYAVTALGVPPGWKDARKIADYIFEVVYQPTYPEPDMSCVLNITNEGFADDPGNPITMNVYDGFYEISSTIEGDVNGDGIVNIQDILIAALAFGSRPGDSNWNPIADLDSNRFINILDLVKIGVNFGKKLPL